MHMRVYLLLCLSVQCTCLVPSEKQVESPGIRATNRTAMWVLGLKAGSPRRAAIALNHQAKSLAPSKCFKDNDVKPVPQKHGNRVSCKR